MNLFLNLKLAERYSNKSQIVRIVTENWVLDNSYCPRCGDKPLNEFENNRPVADFYCKNCLEEFELKSKRGNFPNKITYGVFSTMIERINSENNPNFFFLTYFPNWTIDNFLIIPKQFITEELIIKRPPLSPHARRAGWVGCNINISKLAEAGKVYLIKNSKVIDPEIVKLNFNRTLFLRQKSKDFKGWILDIMRCIDEIKTNVFKLEDVYKFEDKLKLKHPNNKFIKDKIRQQLQFLRDKGIIEFVGRGKYKKVKHEKI